MQEKKFEDRFDDKFDGKELMCVNVNKVYDWIVKENNFDAIPVAAGVGVSFPSIPATLTNPIVTCSVVPSTGVSPALPPIQILNREDRQFCIDGKNICLQQLTIRKNFTVQLTITATEGTFVSPTLLPISRTEVVTLCAPDDTAVEVVYTELNCVISSTGAIAVVGTGATATVTFTNLVVSVNTCQSIQSTFPVTLELFAEFCHPREDFITACPPPSHPPQCPQLFPDHGHGHGHCRDHGCH
ncbi:hypothetical protein MHZ95_10535 [Sporosarcina sp. ACRSM]|uniref:hypothetical protein n=1 Tax=Sporosarcina sp. ACRSM TaxID=2918216 RepID=UPI001EF59A69|nr:hypothetical protein [Sporosarcina sp. ACRSM]MCG7335715.1 hypothetical protein [Sporosarcina sp. ACRSM]